ncbi:hypothetical protein JA9_003876 [Meyerozyma sp. JA9]|nr:hypothetical protein JA9_003876 [Meyerozyma sp. JA9]
MSEKDAPSVSNGQVENESTASSVAPPPLPERDHHTGVDTSILTYSLQDNLSTISMIRQHSLYLTPILNETSDLFGVADLQNKLQLWLDDIGSASVEAPESGSFWKELLLDPVWRPVGDKVDISRENEDKEVGVIEKHLISGIEDNLRPLVYFKILQIRIKLHKESYNNLLRRAINSNSSRDAYIDSLQVDTNLTEVLKVFNYYTNEVISAKGARFDAMNNDSVASSNESFSNLPPNNFIIHVSQLIAQMPNLTNEDTFYLLLKLNKLFINLLKEEFFYKANRTLEDLVPEVFLHITKQGINLTTFFKRVLFSFFAEKLPSQMALFKVLDFVVFEGFDFMHRLFAFVFTFNRDKICSLDGDELQTYIYSQDFFSALAESVAFEEILKIEPTIIKYENDYYLLHANSLNANNLELTNLKENNDDLIIKIQELNQQLENLRTTHTEILSQSDDHDKKLNDVTSKNSQLVQLKLELEQKYENLTMKENLKNTIKANREFSQRNSELEKSIEALKKKVDEKSAKLAKYAT